MTRRRPATAKSKLHSEVESLAKHRGAMCLSEDVLRATVVDAIKGKVLAHNRRGILFDAVKEAINEDFFVLANLSGYTKYLKRLPNMPVFSGDLQLALLGFKYSG